MLALAKPVVSHVLEDKATWGSLTWEAVRTGVLTMEGVEQPYLEELRVAFDGAEGAAALHEASARWQLRIRDASRRRFGGGEGADARGGAGLGGAGYGGGGGSGFLSTSAGGVSRARINRQGSSARGLGGGRGGGGRGGGVRGGRGGRGAGSGLVSSPSHRTAPTYSARGGGRGGGARSAQPPGGVSRQRSFGRAAPTPPRGGTTGSGAAGPSDGGEAAGGGRSSGVARSGVERFLQKFRLREKLKVSPRP